MTQDLATAIADQQPAQRRTAFDLVESMRGELHKALPEHASIDNFLRLALTELKMNPQLGNCSGESLLGALMTAARVGLEVGGPLGQFYLTPRRLKRDGWAVVPIVGYRGLITLARRAGVGQVNAVVVHEGDTFREGASSERGFFFDWEPAVERGKPVGALAAARLAGGDVQHRYLSLAEVHERRDRGGFKDGSNSPWATDYDAMVRKTALRALVPLLPQSTALSFAVQADEQVQRYDAGDIDIPALDETDTEDTK
ncbi:recombinase RecT [Isoptericola dokdonensis]|uniref:Recombination and repair protein RecT n=1 Tax=Isoptericola dokdonensis DS-3 TaxID=1300344 RepID=A0A168FDR8_9MICO|nr:recombinase RecT [Isoptericola dokdonensis]ANC31466.1 recombination and repair protein RecT [Isoptericola dokdonensis DS-3]